MKHKEVHDHRGFANMPREVVMKEYPKHGFALHEELDDTITGIDETARDNATQIRKHRSKSMY